MSGGCQSRLPTRILNPICGWQMRVRVCLVTHPLWYEHQRRARKNACFMRVCFAEIPTVAPSVGKWQSHCRRLQVVDLPMHLPPAHWILGIGISIGAGRLSVEYTTRSPTARAPTGGRPRGPPTHSCALRAVGTAVTEGARCRREPISRAAGRRPTPTGCDRAIAAQTDANKRGAVAHLEAWRVLGSLWRQRR